MKDTTPDGWHKVGALMKDYLDLLAVHDRLMDSYDDDAAPGLRTWSWNELGKLCVAIQEAMPVRAVTPIELARLSRARTTAANAADPGE
jgi:hypothetical protein